MIEDLRKLIGWKLVDVTSSQDTGWVTMHFEKAATARSGRRRAAYRYTPTAALPVEEES